jgi:hypothetical protein
MERTTSKLPENYSINNSVSYVSEFFDYSNLTAQIRDNINFFQRITEGLKSTDQFNFSTSNLLKNLSNIYKVQTTLAEEEKEISIVVSLFSKVDRVESIYAKCDNGFYDIKIFTANDKYDAELMERLFNIEDTIFEVMETENFNFEYLPAKYLNTKDVLSEKYYIIFKG